jgi:glycosyltransferase involved in cell wall biosynthesis
MSIADVIVIPSQEYESFGLTAIEAMSYGIPIVATNIGGLPETIGENGDCGFHTDIGDINEFSRNIIRLIKDESLAKKMGKNGLDRVDKLFQPNRMAREYQSLIQKNN